MRRLSAFQRVKGELDALVRSRDFKSREGSCKGSLEGSIPLLSRCIIKAMRVSEYVEKGLKNMVEEKPEGYMELGKCTSGCHSVVYFIKGTTEKVEDVKFKATKRCKKLLAVADFVAQKIKERGKVELKEEEVLNYFSDEKEQDKLKDRLNIVKTALGL